MKKRGGFFKSNWAYLIWFAIYFSIAVVTIDVFVNDIWLSLLYSAVLYGVSVGVALSPLGESILRILENIKPLQTQEDKDYLMPIFEEVYSEALSFTPEMRKDIQLYISESMTVNAFAIGSKTIVVTRGALYAFTPDELKGILSHELGHMANGDTKALLLSVIGNGFFSIIILILRFIMLLIQNISIAFSGKNIVVAVFAVIAFVSRVFVDISIIAFIFISDVILALNSRYSELLADEYAYQIGYGEELKNSLYTIGKISLPAKATITERLRASHPHIAERIEKLEILLGA